MNMYIHVRCVAKAERVPPGLMSEFQRRCPHLITPPGFVSFGRPLGHPDLDLAISLFEFYGLKRSSPLPWSEERKTDDQRYSYSLMREYTLKDYADVPLFLVQGHNDIIADYITSLDPYLIGADKLPKSDRKIASSPGRPYHVVVSSRFRRDAEAAGLIGMVFKDTLPGVPRKGELCRYDPTRWSVVNSEPWYVLSSSIRLPPMSPRTLMVTPQRTLWTPGDPAKKVQIYEPFHSIVEASYRREDVAPFEPFDVALTHEPLGDPDRLVVSQRFHQFCIAKKYQFYRNCVRYDEPVEVPKL